MDHIDFEAVGWGIEQLLFFFTQIFFMTKCFFFICIFVRNFFVFCKSFASIFGICPTLELPLLLCLFSCKCVQQVLLNVALSTLETLEIRISLLSGAYLSAASQRTFLYQAVLLWNSLPASLRERTSVIN